ncbi:hypothetical protein BOX15_Mlig033925g1, partial [Macrostomum lignano]
QHDFFDFEDILKRDFELKKDRLTDFLKKAGLAEGQQVLELGCGFAPLLEFYCDTVGPSGGVTLVDPEPRLAERLAPRLASRPNARFAVSSAEDLASVLPAGGAFDLAVMANVYHHLADTATALAAVRSALRPGGRLVILDFIHDTLQLFASEAANPAALAVQARLADLLRPAASPVTARCCSALAAAGFEVRLRDAFVLHDRLRSPLGDFYVDAYVKHSLHELASLGRITKEEVAELLGQGLPTLQQGDPEAELFSNINLLVAAERP